MSRRYTRKSLKRSAEDEEGTPVPQITDVPSGHGRPSTTANVELRKRVHDEPGALVGDPSMENPEARRDLATLIKNLNKEMNRGFGLVHDRLDHLEGTQEEFQKRVTHMEEY